MSPYAWSVVTFPKPLYGDDRWYAMSLQAVSKHLRVLEDAGVVSRRPGPQPRAVHLESGVFDLMEQWIERYRRQAEERYQRLDAVLAEMSETEEGSAE